MMQVLSRRTKNNPVLIGEPGVGKTAIVEGLAQRIEPRGACWMAAKIDLPRRRAGQRLDEAQFGRELVAGEHLRRIGEQLVDLHAVHGPQFHRGDGNRAQPRVGSR